jgi:hypothetical protein
MRRGDYQTCHDKTVNYFGRKAMQTAPGKKDALSVVLVLLTLAALLVPAYAAKRRVEFETVAKQGMSSHREKQNYVITNTADWANLWNKAFETSNRVPPLPEIDFTERMVIAVFRGTTPDPCHDVKITKLIETEGVLKVHAREKLPGRGCGCVAVIGAPFHIIVIPKTGKPVVFKLKEKTIACE